MSIDRDPLAGYYAVFSVLEGAAAQAHKAGRKEIYVEDVMKAINESANVAKNLYEYYKDKNGR